MISRENILHLAREVGFNCCGITRCEDLGEYASAFEEWLSAGFASGLDYLSRRVELRRNPQGLFEGARSIIVCAVNYRNELSKGYPSEFAGAKVASYAIGRDYHLTIKEMLGVMLTRLQEQYPSLVGRCYTDTAPLLEKSMAVRAGLGRVGRNSLLITPDYGSFVLLGELVIDAYVDAYDQPMDWEPCGGCTLCLKRCPVAAINDNRTIDPRRCISARTLETDSGELPLKGWVCGCDECQTHCPHNVGKPLYDNPQFAPLLNPLSDEGQQLLSSEQLPDLLSSTPVSRAFRRRTKTNNLPPKTAE